jgi:hypothetical protein
VRETLLFSSVDRRSRRSIRISTAGELFRHVKGAFTRRRPDVGAALPWLGET